MKSLLQELKKINEEAAAGAISAGNIAGVRGGVGGAEVNSQSEFKKKKKKKRKMRRRPMNVQETVDSTFDQADVISKLKQAERANVTDEETTSFALEDDTGTIIKVTVRKDQAEDFEAALGMALAAKDEDEDNINSEKEIAEVLFDLKDKFEIVDVDFPAIPEDEEEDQTVEGEGDDLGLEDDTEGEGEGDDMDMEDEGDDMDMEADTEETDAGTALTQVIDMMKADAEAKKAEAEARSAEAKAEESRYAAQASVAKVKQEEQILDMESHNDRKKKENEEAKRLAQLAKYKHEVDAEGEGEDVYPEEEENTAAPEVSKEELLTMLQKMLRHNQ